MAFFEFLFSFLGTMAFAIMINVPRKALLACGIAGSAGWMSYWFLYNNFGGRIISNMIGAFIAGAIGLFFARHLKMPVITFNIPAIVPLVPGVTAYQAIREMVVGNFTRSLNLMFVVFFVIGAIALGFMLSQLIDELFRKIPNRIARKN